MGIILRMLPAVFAFACSPFLYGQAVLENPRLHALVFQGIDLTWKQDFTAADSVFQVLTGEFPDHPAGFIYRAGVKLTFAEDHEKLLDRVEFDSLLDVGREKARLMLSSRSEAKWGQFFLATADGTDSYARVYRGDWMGGAAKGLASVGGFERALKLDSAMVDAYAGIGAFNYWRSKKTEYFNWLPFLGDARPEAFRMLRKTADDGVYNRATALSMLIAVYLDAGKYELAVDCARQGLSQYPANRTFLWALSTIFDRMKKYAEASRSYAELLASIEKDPAGNAYNEFVARLNLAESLMHTGESGRARSLLALVLQIQPLQFGEHLQSRVRNNLDRALRLERRLSTTPGETR